MIDTKIHPSQTNDKELLDSLKRDEKGYILGFNGKTRAMMNFMYSYYELSQELSKIDRSELFNAILEYSFKGVFPTFKKKSISNYFLLILPQLRYNLDQWLKATKRKSGVAHNPSGRNQYTRNQSNNQEKEDTRKDTREDTHVPSHAIHEYNEIYEDKKNSLTRVKKVPTGGTPSPSKNRVFEIPSLEDVKAYGTSIGVTEAQAEFYHDAKTANGWTLGNGKSVKDWQADLRVWKRKGYLDNKQPTSTRTNAQSGGATITPKWAE